MRRQSTLGRNLAIFAGVSVVLFLVAAAIGNAPSRSRSSSGTSAPRKIDSPAITTSETATRTAESTAANSSSSDPDVRADGGLDYLTMKAEAEEQLKAKLADDHGVRYRDVHTRLSTLEGRGIVAFCGEVNSRTPLNGYGGFERFLASRSVAATESTMPADDFAQAWSRFCTDGVEGPKVWF